MDKAVSFFGSARLPREAPEYGLARATAASLGRAGFAVITGGAGGIMEAENRGAHEGGSSSLAAMARSTSFPRRSPLIQTHKIRHFPVVLVGGDHWDGLVEWLGGRLVEAGTLSKADVSLIHRTDNPKRVSALAEEAWREQRRLYGRPQEA